MSTYVSNETRDTANTGWLAVERPRLVRLCAHLAGRADAAEDLAQETLLEAWRNRAKLAPDVDAGERAKWLNAIARNVCLRGRREHGRTALAASLTPEGEAVPIAESLADSADIELELERDELALLLDRALAHLPPSSRSVLLQRFIEETPHAEIAARLGVSEDVVAQRLHRGKLALRRVLTSDLRDEALALGLSVPQASEWQETRIFCPFCGLRSLRCRIEPKTGEARFRCAGDCAFPSGMICGVNGAVEITGALTSPKSVLKRILGRLDAHYREQLTAGSSACPGCGGPTTIYIGIPDEVDVPHYLRDLHGLHVVCPTCGPLDSATLWHLALDHPVALAFWRAHPRVRALPISKIESDGQVAFVTGFESARGGERIEIVTARDSLRVLGVFPTP